MIMRSSVILRVLLFVTAATLLYTGVQCAGAQTEEPTEVVPVRSEKEQCRASGGQWMMFNNGCLDSCEYRRGEVTMCTQVRQMGCYCKGARCWNGSRCEDT